MKNNITKGLTDKQLYHRTMNKTAVFTALFFAIIGALIGGAICMLVPIPESMKTMATFGAILTGAGINFVFGTVFGLIFGSTEGYYKLSIRDRNRKETT